jgi:hypothetical protein
MINRLDNDERLLNLAHAVARAYKYSSNGLIPEMAHQWLDQWEEFQGKDHLVKNAEYDYLYEVRIWILLKLLRTADCPERKDILRSIAHNVHSYAIDASNSPSGAFGKHIGVCVINVLDKVI